MAVHQAFVGLFSWHLTVLFIGSNPDASPSPYGVTRVHPSSSAELGRGGALTFLAGPSGCTATLARSRVMEEIVNFIAGTLQQRSQNPLGPQVIPPSSTLRPRCVLIVFSPPTADAARPLLLAAMPGHESTKVPSVLFIFYFYPVHQLQASN